MSALIIVITVINEYAKQTNLFNKYFNFESCSVSYKAKSVVFFICKRNIDSKCELIWGDSWLPFLVLLSNVSIYSNFRLFISLCY